MGKTTKNTSTRLRDENAPKLPMNAYSRYFKANLSNSKREGKNTKEVSSKLAKQWSTMSGEEKKPYFDEYNREREIYYERMKEYKETEQYKEFQRKKLDKKKQSRKSRSNVEEEQSSTSNISVQPPKGIKIFSQEFLDYNKKQENILRTLRNKKNNITNECDNISEHFNFTNEQLKYLNENIKEKQEYYEELNLFERKTMDDILDALDKVDLLESLKIKRQSTTLEEIIKQFIEISQSNKEMFSKIREAFQGIHFDFSILFEDPK
uniref:HMG box domain-containing protein n=1 Tax=Meloidogyne hapla TaxID=6305 RepID=A0A1I8BMT0_MELHA